MWFFCNLFFLNITEIRGFLRNIFQLQKNQDNRYLGTITDGQYKLDVMIYIGTENNGVEFERGKKLELIGDLQKKG